MFLCLLFVCTNATMDGLGENIFTEKQRNDEHAQYAIINDDYYVYIKNFDVVMKYAVANDDAFGESYCAREDLSDYVNEEEDVYAQNMYIHVKNDIICTEYTIYMMNETDVNYLYSFVRKVANINLHIRCYAN